MIKQLTALPAKLRQILTFLKKNLAICIKLVKNLLSLMKSKLDPARLLKLFKSQLAQFAKRFRSVAAQMKQFLMSIGLLDAAFNVLETFRMVLQFLFTWFKEITVVRKAASDCLKDCKKVVKEVKTDLNNLTKVVKKTNGFKIPA